MKNGIVLIPFVDARTSKSYNVNADFSAKEKRFNELVALGLITEVSMDDNSDKNVKKSNTNLANSNNHKSSNKLEDLSDLDSGEESDNLENNDSGEESDEENSDSGEELDDLKNSESNNESKK